MIAEQSVLEASVARLRSLVESLGPEELRAQGYPSEWTVADVLSHLGSGAEIAILRIDYALGGAEVEAEPIWDEWNGKDPDAKASDALRADRLLVERLDALTEAERASLTIAMGPLSLDVAGFLRLRVNEHVLHSWDIAVVFDPGATLPPDGVGVALEVLPMIAGFAGKPTASAKQLRVRTTAPDRHYVIALAADGVSLTPDDDAGAPDLELPAEALVRLVYGRLDPEHTPAVNVGEAELDELRRAFPGV
ncbi:MAG: hypothetical protein QOJ67_150 [Acidimicrobiaceae bacterium]